jgi:DinB superfamily
MSEAFIGHALDVLAATPATLTSLLGGLSPELTSAPADDGWSPHDVVAHLASLDPLTLVGRVRSIVEQDQSMLAAIDEQDVLERSGLREKALADLLDEMTATRAAAMVWLRGLSPELFERTGQHSEVGLLSATEILHHKAWHDLLHIQQVCRMLSVPLDAGSGGMRRWH